MTNRHNLLSANQNLLSANQNLLSANQNLSRPWMCLCGATAFALGTTLVSLTWAEEEPKPVAASTQPTGLRGILPAEVPGSLSEDAFAVLDGNWKEWSQKTSTEVAKLYTDADLDVAGQRKQLDVLKKKLETMEKSLKDPRFRSIHEALSDLHSALNRRVTLAEAILDTLTLDPQKAATARIDAARQEIAKSVKVLESDLKSLKNGQAWLSYVRSADIVKLVGEKKAAQEALPVLSAVQQKLSPSDTMSPEIRKFLDREQLVALRSSLDNFVRVAAAVDQPVNLEKLHAELANLVSAVEKYEENPSTTEASAVRKAFEAARKLTADGGNLLAQAMSTHYFNYNLRVVLSEGFLSRLIGEASSKQGPVDDFILGAKVDGAQSTTTTPGIDMKSSNNGVKFHLTLNGVTQSNTQGVTDQATVFTSGYHSFTAWKPISFDGNKFVTSPADISVYPNNTTTGVQTGMSGVPIFGGFADGVARRKVGEKRAESEAIASQRLSSRVLPEFNKEVDKKITELNQKVESDVNARLRQMELMPSATSYRSTDSEMRAYTRLMADHELAGGDGPFASVPSKGFIVGLHESLLNNSIDRLKFAGRTMSEDEVKTEIEKSFSDLIGRPINALKKIEAAGESSKDKEPATFVFPSKDPIRFRITNGQLVLVIRAGLKQKEGEEDIPTQEITVPLMFRVEGTNFVVESGQVGVSPVEPPKNAGLQIARAGVVRTKIQNALPTRKFNRVINVDKSKKTPVMVGLAQFKAAGGWLVITFE